MSVLHEHVTTYCTARELNHHNACADAGTAFTPLLRGGTRVRRWQPDRNPSILRAKVFWVQIRRGF